jgi:hypothetical protein
MGSGSSFSKPVPPRRQTERCKPTEGDLEASGKVTYHVSQISFSALLAAGDAIGTFVTESGYWGEFHTSFEGIFIGAAAPAGSYGIGTSRNLATFNGVNYNLIGALAFYSFSDSYDPESLDHVGEADELTTPGLGIGGTRSRTSLTSIHCPGT